MDGWTEGPGHGHLWMDEWLDQNQNFVLVIRSKQYTMNDLDCWMDGR